LLCPSRDGALGVIGVSGMAVLSIIIFGVVLAPKLSTL